MQSEEQVRNVIAELYTIAEPLPQPTDVAPLVQTSTSAPRRRLTARRLYQRRRQRLQQLMQQQEKPSSP